MGGSGRRGEVVFGGWCPLPPVEQRWVEKGMWWCVGAFGSAAVRGEVAVPEAGFWPEGYDGSRACIEELARRVGAVMGVEVPRGGGWVDPGAGAAEPARVAAVVARELGRVRLAELGRAEQVERVEPEARLADLVTVFLGMGVFTANAARELAKPGDMTERQFGYAMACYSLLRRENAPDWARYLEPEPRAALEQGLRYFARSR